MPSVVSAFLMASISPWQVESLFFNTQLWPVATTLPSFTTTAPNGPPWPLLMPALASAIARSINSFLYILVLYHFVKFYLWFVVFKDLGLKKTSSIHFHI